MENVNAKVQTSVNPFFVMNDPSYGDVGSDTSIHVTVAAMK